MKGVITLSVNNRCPECGGNIIFDILDEEYKCLTGSHTIVVRVADDESLMLFVEHPVTNYLEIEEQRVRQRNAGREGEYLRLRAKARKARSDKQVVVEAVA